MSEAKILPLLVQFKSGLVADCGLLVDEIWYNYKFYANQQEKGNLCVPKNAQQFFETQFKTNDPKNESFQNQLESVPELLAEQQD